MKKRYGFVSNSSSSCFVCLISGKKASGWDLSLSKAEMCRCVNGHTISNEYRFQFKELTHEDYEKLIKENYEGELTEYEVKSYNRMMEALKDKDYSEIDSYFDLKSGYDFPEDQCPICSFKHFLAEDVLNYLYNSKVSKQEIEAEISQKFKNYNDFKTFKNS